MEEDVWERRERSRKEEECEEVEAFRRLKVIQILSGEHLFDPDQGGLQN